MGIITIFIWQIDPRFVGLVVHFPFFYNDSVLLLFRDSVNWQILLEMLPMEILDRFQDLGLASLVGASEQRVPLRLVVKDEGAVGLLRLFGLEECQSPQAHDLESSINH